MSEALEVPSRCFTQFWAEMPALQPSEEQFWKPEQLEGLNGSCKEDMSALKFCGVNGVMGT